MEKIKDNAVQTNKIGIYSTTMIAVAYAITNNNFTVGANVGANMSFTHGIAAIIVTWILLSVLWSFSGMMGQISGKNSAEIFRYVFGIKGGKIPSLCMSIALVVWAIFDYWYVGAVMRNMMPNAPHVGFTIGMIIITLAAIVGTIKDITSLKWFTGITVPAALILFVVLLVVTIQRSGFETISSFRPTTEMGFVTGVNILFASFTGTCPGFSDITKNSSSKKAVIIAMTLGMGVVGFQFFAAQVGAIGLAVVDFTSLVLALGGAIFYVSNIYLIIGQSNTVPSNTFIISTQFYESIRIPKKVTIFVQPILAAVLAYIVEYVADITILNSWVGVIGIMFGPILAILFCDFYITYHRDISFPESDLPAFCKVSVLTLVIGMAAGAYCTYFSSVELPSFFIGFIISFVLQYILRKYSK